MTVELIGTDELGRSHFKGLNADTRPHGEVGSTYIITDSNGGEEKYYGEVAGWLNSNTAGAINVMPDSIQATSGGQSESVALSGTSAQSSAILSDRCTVFVTVDCFIRHGSNPTALSTGVDDIIPAGNKVRISGIIPGNKLAFITGGATGTAYITPGA